MKQLLFSAFLLFSFILYSSAECPNQCNGHGVCNQFDVCLCYLSAEGFPEYTGADCSLRTCPR